MSVRRTRLLLVGACALVLGWSPIFASASFVLQTANNPTGNQAFSGVGVRFSVDSPVTVSALGIFDSDQDGIAASPTDPLSAYLMTGTGTTVSSMTFDSASSGTLDAISLYRFKPISAVTLPVGVYILVGYGFTGFDLEHNAAVGGSVETFNDGGGLLTYIDAPFGLGADPPGTLPALTVPPFNYFSAANMLYDRADGTGVPEARGWLFVAGIGLTFLGYLAATPIRRRWSSSQG